jgi:translation initiation factor IF-1
MAGRAAARLNARILGVFALYSRQRAEFRPYFFVKRRMSKEDSIEVTGTVVEKFPSGLFSVQLDQDRTVLAHLAGKLRRNRIRVLAGDRVTLEMSPYDLTKGRITYRHK